VCVFVSIFLFFTLFVISVCASIVMLIAQLVDFFNELLAKILLSYFTNQTVIAIARNLHFFTLW